MERDILGALIFYAGVPFMVFLSLQLVYERVELMPNRLVYAREPPHQSLDVAIRWNQIASVTKRQHEAQEILTGKHFRCGYQFTLLDGTAHNLLVCDTLTAAASQIDKRLADLRIPVRIEIIPLG